MDELSERELLLRLVTQFGRERIKQLADDVVRELQTYPAIGLFGDDARAKTLWDEYSYDRQHGPATMLEHAWAQALEPALQHVIQPIDHAEAVLLTFYCGWTGGEDPFELVGNPPTVSARDTLEAAITAKLTYLGVNHRLPDAHDSDEVDESEEDAL